MKLLFILTLGQFGSSSRIFGNNPEFRSARETWWSDIVSRNQFEKLKIATKAYFDNYYPNSGKVMK